MQSIIVRKATVAHLVALAHPGYKGRTFRVSTAGRLMFTNVHWSGGTRSEYRAVRLTDGATAELAVGTPWDSPSEWKEVQIPTDVAIVEHTVYCGRDCGIVVHVNPESALGRSLLGTSHRAPRIEKRQPDGSYAIDGAE